MKSTLKALLAATLILGATWAQAGCGTGTVTRIFIGGNNTDVIHFALDDSVEVRTLAAGSWNYNAIDPARMSATRFDHLLSVLQTALVTGKKVTANTSHGSCAYVSEIQLIQ